MTTSAVGQGEFPSKDRVWLEGQLLVGEDFSGRKMPHFGSVGSRFERCNFDKTVVTGAAFGAGGVVSEYVECSFDGAKLRPSSSGFSRFERCSFENVDIFSWFCFSVELVDCTFSGRISKALFNGTVPGNNREYISREKNQIEGNDFSRAQLHDVGFRTGVDLTKQKFPTGDGYFYFEDGAAAIRKAQAVYDSWDDPEMKAHVKINIELMNEDFAKGQKQFFIRPDNYLIRARPALHALFEAVRDT